MGQSPQLFRKFHLKVSHGPIERDVLEIVIFSSALFQYRKGIVQVINSRKGKLLHVQKTANSIGPSGKDSFAQEK